METRASWVLGKHTPNWITSPTPPCENSMQIKHLKESPAYSKPFINIRCGVVCLQIHMHTCWQVVLGTHWISVLREAETGRGQSTGCGPGPGRVASSWNHRRDIQDIVSSPGSWSKLGGQCWLLNTRLDSSQESEQWQGRFLGSRCQEGEGQKGLEVCSEPGRRILGSELPPCPLCSAFYFIPSF